jgi:hypothetical protein
MPTGVRWGLIGPSCGTTAAHCAPIDSKCSATFVLAAGRMSGRTFASFARIASTRAGIYGNCVRIVVMRNGTCVMCATIARSIGDVFACGAGLVSLPAGTRRRSAPQRGAVTSPNHKSPITNRR